MRLAALLAIVSAGFIIVAASGFAFTAQDNIDLYLDKIDLVSKAATISGIIVAAVSALLAVSAIQSNAATARSAHMHNLFRDYLHLAMDYGKNNKNHRSFIGYHLQESPESSKINFGSMIAFKLYTLEEMYIWIENEKNIDRWRYFDLFHSTYNRKSYLNGWLETIKYHLNIDKEATKTRLNKYESCYGKNFVEFANMHWDSDNSHEQKPLRPHRLIG